MAAPEKLELRGLYDRELVEALDMLALAKRLTRSDLVGRVLRSYVASKQHEAMLIAKSPRVNPPAADSDWSELA